MFFDQNKGSGHVYKYLGCRQAGHFSLSACSFIWAPQGRCLCLIHVRMPSTWPRADTRQVPLRYLWINHPTSRYSVCPYIFISLCTLHILFFILWTMRKDKNLECTKLNQKTEPCLDEIYNQLREREKKQAQKVVPVWKRYKTSLKITQNRIHVNP